MRLLWFGDAACHTGFATVTHSILDVLKERHDVFVCGINYRGDPHPYPYPIYPAGICGDQWGVRRLHELTQTIEPDVIIINNDAWNVARFMQWPDVGVPILAYIPVDGHIIDRRTMPRLCGVSDSEAKIHNKLAAAIWYTEFGRREAEQAGFTGKSYVVPHGIDLEMYQSVPKDEARKVTGLPQGAYVVGNVNRNQYRKRLDITLRGFADLAEHRSDALLYLHCYEHDEHFRIHDYVKSLGLEGKVFLPQNKTSMYGIGVDMMKYVYSSFDLQISTSMGEGWGLTTMEGAACGVPQIVPAHTAFLEWAEEAAILHPSDPVVMNYGINMVMYPPTVSQVGYVLRSEYRQTFAEQRFGLSDERYQWPNIAARFETIVSEAMESYVAFHAG